MNFGFNVLGYTITSVVLTLIFFFGINLTHTVMEIIH